MRIDKYICDTVNITRSAVRRKISDGCVSVDGQVIKSCSYQVDERSASVRLSGELIGYNKYVYIMMNKPAGVISASEDKHCNTAIDLLKDCDRRSDLFIAGRLDKDTTGFLLITNDGDFAHNILSPKKHIDKTYEVQLVSDMQAGYAAAMKDGVVIDGGYRCKPAKLEAISPRQCRLTISEGKFHQIKRMFQALGNEVIALKRIQMGNLCLDNSLNTGEYRYLSDKEMNLLLCKIDKNDL